MYEALEIEGETRSYLAHHQNPVEGIACDVIVAEAWTSTVTIDFPAGHVLLLSKVRDGNTQRSVAIPKGRVFRTTQLTLHTC